MADIVTSAVTSFLESAGTLAPVLLAFGIYILKKDKRIDALQAEVAEAHEARVRDAQAVTEGLIKLNDKWMAALNANTTAMNNIREALYKREHEDEED
jgi:hypothetical protein